MENTSEISVRSSRTSSLKQALWQRKRSATSAPCALSRPRLMKQIVMLSALMSLMKSLRNLAMLLVVLHVFFYILLFIWFPIFLTAIIPRHFLLTFVDLFYLLNDSSGCRIGCFVRQRGHRRSPLVWWFARD